VNAGLYRGCCAQRITGDKQPALQDTYSTWMSQEGKKIGKDINHSSNGLFTLLSPRM
jgi:hypothetical protein